ncbi:DEAD/DEAH box helicase [Bacillus testis]|uniref:DEAD/DEAH box helicase n=1 Tax=Bacillus testis TaxID=1622072 RepID=UPI00067EE363|nr:DEAD/DEAH box helicase [Bacillus testis]
MAKHTFKEFPLHEEIQRAIEELGYQQPTDVQARVIPLALEKKDLIVKSKTGSGKTAAFAIPLCESVAWEENKPQVLILTPTRELAAQIQNDITNIGRYKRIKAVALFGKQSFEKQKIQLSQKVHMIVGTPGRTLDHIKKGTLVLDHIDYLVLDESDEMLNMGFIEQVEAIMERLPKNKATFLFSATIPDDIDQLARVHMDHPSLIEIKDDAHSGGSIKEAIVMIADSDRLSVFLDLVTVENPDSCMVFCRTQERVDDLHSQLKRLHFTCEKIHGGMRQEERFDVMERFRKGAFRYLVATDVAARGIDIESISLVVNYDMPLEKESYVHRTGRTGRAGKAGKAITLVSGRDREKLDAIEAFLGRSIPAMERPDRENVQKSKAAFTEKMGRKPTLKKDKSESMNQHIMKLYFNGGKKKKIRAVDFVGTICSIPGVNADDIGIITIQDICSYVEIMNGKGPLVLQAMKNKKIKGKQLKVHKALK